MNDFTTYRTNKIDLLNKEELKRRLEESIELMEFLPVAVTIHNERGIVVRSNQEAIHLLGLYHKSDGTWSMDIDNCKVVRKDYTILPKEEFACVTALKLNQKIIDKEVGIVRNGEVTWINVTAIPLHSQKGVVVIYFDITEKVNREKELEDLNKKLQEFIQERDRFYGIIAHDLKNPFSSIHGFCELILSPEHRYSIEEIEQFVGIISSSSKQAYDLLENLLKWSRSHAGILEFEPEYLDLASLIPENIKLVANQARIKNITFKLDFHDSYVAFADKNMVNTVIRNLVINSIKYSHPNNEIIISINNLPTHVSVCIRDFGVGIPKEHLENLFRADKKFSTYGTANERGNGLGLLLCQEFIAKHQGKIWVESEVGKGSSFYFTVSKENFAYNMVK